MSQQSEPVQWRIIPKRLKINEGIFQILPERGIFNTYHEKINKETTSKCQDCDEELEDAQYALENHAEKTLTPRNLTDTVAESEQLWKHFNELCRTIMKNRQEKEKQHEFFRRRKRSRRAQNIP